MVDEAVAANRLGSVVDERYQILEIIASGAMGAVYKAERVPVGKLVAVKFLHASVAQDDEFQTRFERETHAMSRLAHPNCVSVLDFGVWDGAPYLVMDYVAGTTLRAAIDDGPIPAAKALTLARQIAVGLAHAHEQGVVHRDIKPANIMITEEIGHGVRVRILDFGLARLRASTESGRDATRTNMVVGTPNYMAPEQTVPGNSLDARADIYALGVVLFEMIVGERPFQAEETLQLLGMHRAAPVPRLADRVPEGVNVPAGLQDVVDKALAKSPDQRYQTAMELAAALDEIMGGGAEPTQVAVTLEPPGDAASDSPSFERPRQRRLFLSVIAGVSIICGAVAIAGYFINHDAEKPHTVGTSSAVHSDADPAMAAGAGAAASTNAVELSRADDAGHAIAPNDGTVAGGAAPDPNQAVETGSAAAATGSAAVAETGSAAVGTGSAAAAGTGSAVTDASAPDLAGEADPGPSRKDDEIELDPSTAEDLDPGQHSNSIAEEEAENAPKTPDEADRPGPAPQRLADNLHDAVQLIVAGKRETAEASLRALHKKSPKSAYIPFLLGNLYFDQRWWSVAMDYYGEAIKKNALYRRNPAINRNVINMLSSGKTRQRAINFIRGRIGHPAAPYLRAAATHGQNATIRKHAAALARVVH